MMSSVTRAHLLSVFVFIFGVFIFPRYASATAAVTPAEKLQQDIKRLGVKAVTAAEYKVGTYKHIVLFRYKSEVKMEQRAEVVKKFFALKTSAQRDGKPYIVSIENGIQNSGEGVDGGFEDGFIVTFKSEGDRNYYVGQPVITDPHFFDPAHQDFKSFVGPLLQKGSGGVLVFDFCTNALTF